MFDLSIILPSIRTKNLIKFYKAAKKSCKKYSFEIIIISPYNPPEELLKKENITYLHSLENTTVCIQKAVLLTRGYYIYNITDDALLEENAIDEALDLLEEKSYETIINMRYNEGTLNPETLEKIKDETFSESYWLAGTHDGLRLPKINPNWIACQHFIMTADYFKDIGGLDCSLFEYNSHAIHDLMFRCQTVGSTILNSPIVAANCSHLPCHTGDHGPVHDAHTIDSHIFNNIYTNHNIEDRIKLDYNSWKSISLIWKRRFNKI